ncbi:type IV secretion system DNA-binding domain-containing protein [uncultured Pseudoalteromonas sp.]|uniref:type IV secretion system DNA-binding domain-containing protein n=1 Tax=uncultured Pseudoalteromonas sp. TaxID=114053 RepID=UPI00259A404C|nr:type IV secretion system DNA-binding domain-containing protein [uncultured Pseudoalteromonas sp.]
MTTDRSNPIFHENLYRPVFEVQIACWYFTGAVITATSMEWQFKEGNVGAVGLAATCILSIQGVNTVRKAVPIVKRQLKLFFNKITFEPIERLRVEHDAVAFKTKGDDYNPKKNVIYIGDGFEWGVEHANRSHQILGFNTTKDEIKLPIIFKPFMRKWSEQTKKLGGKPWIQGIGDERRQYVNADTFFGHTMITGNVGTGKTTLFSLLSTAMIHKNYTVIVLDPKNDSAWRKSLQRELAYWGREDDFHYFHPSQPSTSCKIDPVKNWNRATEIAERISSIMVESGKEDSFVRFNWNVINSTVNAMIYAGIQPQIKTIARYATNDKARLAEKCLEAHYAKTFGPDWKKLKDRELDKFGAANLERLINHYNTVVITSNPSTEVEGIIGVVMHNAEHMQKMTANLLPIFSVLTSKPLDELISPEEDPSELTHAHTDYQEDDLEELHQQLDNGDEAIVSPITLDEDNNIKTDEAKQAEFIKAQDKNRAKSTIKSKKTASRLVDTADIVERGGVLYMALDSMSDTKTAGYLAKLVLADIAAVAGSRYNFSDGKGRRVAVFVDEVHAAIAGNDALLNILAQGRAACFQMFIATQNKADLEAKTDTATANRVLGLCNNFFSMRANDASTQEYAAKQFGEVPISSQQITLGQSSGNTDEITDFGSSYSERLTKQNGPAFSESLLGSLPILQYIARLADGRTIKARIPVIKHDK